MPDDAPMASAPVPPAPGPPEHQVTAGEPAPWRARWARLWSNLNLNGPVPARVRPAIGEWGPTRLPSTRQKKRGRWLAPVAFTLMLAIVALTIWFFWTKFR